jgi:choline dehydrogenase
MSICLSRAEYVSQVGGSSILNYMAYAVGTKGTFDGKWVQATGDESWNWENVAPYYKKSGNFTPPDLSKRAANTTPLYDISSYGVGGPLSLSYPNYGEPFSTYVELALEEVGIVPQDGFTSGVLNGSSWMVYTINATTGTRASSEKAFLQPVLGRPNLALLNETLAEKIIWNGQVARGVQISVGNTSYAALASREVILAAGAFQSPQLLLVSGVGPASTLSQHSIELVHDLPGVGQDLNDHIFFGVTYRVNVQTESALAYGDASEQAIDQFNTDHTGQLSTSGGDYVGYEKLPPEWRAALSPQALHGTSVISVRAALEASPQSLTIRNVRSLW